MPHDIETYTGESAKAKAREAGRLDAQCPADLVGVVTKTVLVGSSFNDPGEDWTRWDCYDAAGARVHTRTVPGF